MKNRFFKRCGRGIAYLFVVCSVFSGCMDYEYLGWAVRSITTNEATHVNSHVARLNGEISLNEECMRSGSLSCGFIYDTSPDFSHRALKVNGYYRTGEYYLVVTGLRPNTTYYYRAYAGDKFGKVRSFTTLPLDSSTDTEGSHPQAVDLGLSVKWASCNVGAESPEEYGSYFAWGETQEKSDYSSSTSVTCGLSIDELESRGIIGSDGKLTAEYDAATANWGGDWRMPTLDEMVELVNNCTWSWTTQNGVYGRRVTGPNGNSIFLPAAGYRYGTSLYDAGSDGHYWSAMLYGNSYGAGAGYLRFYSDDYYWYSYDRSYGFTVRPVSE